MEYPKILPVKNAQNLRDRVEGFFKGTRTFALDRSPTRQLSFELFSKEEKTGEVYVPRSDITSFLDFASGAVSGGDIYLFGGIIRDLAIFGKEGFKSDIDIVVDGKWGGLVRHLIAYGATRNKFGGFRLMVGEWPVDIWRAKETWAVRQGFVKYKGVSSLNATTVLNWDGILMNWRTKRFIHDAEYFEQICSRTLDVVLTENPNPLGMIVRILRHLRHKDAAKISMRAVKFIADATRKFDYEEIKKSEFSSYGNTLIDKKLHHFFYSISKYNDNEIRNEFGLAESGTSKNVRDQLIGQVTLFH